MNKKLNKLFSATLVLMMVLSQSSNLIATLYASSEYLSEASEVASSEVVSEQLESEVQESSTVAEVEQDNKTVSIDKATTQEQVSTEKQTRAYTDMSGVGNQNKSTIGQGTYIHPNEETEDKLKDINEMQKLDSTTYVAVSDLNANLIEVASAGEHLSEGVISKQFPSTMSTDEINSQIAKSLTFNGSCWTPSKSNMLNIPNDGNIMNIQKKIIDSDVCSLVFTDFGYYYNIETFEYKPVDMILDVKYVDFYTSPDELTSAHLGIGVFDSWGLFFETFRVDEFEYSFDFKLKDGTLIDVPILYEHSDFDLSLSMGFNKDDLHKLVTYYQDPITSKHGQYTEPWIASANEEFAGKYVNSDQFNFKSYYDYVEKNYNKGMITASDVPYYTRYFKRDRSFLNAITSINNADGEATPSDRGWNRLKVLENDNNVAMFESWGVNTASNGVSENNKLANFTSSGKDGRFAVVMDSSSTMTLNQNSAYFGFDPTVQAGYTQGSGINPYKNTDTIITKNMSDANSNQVAEIGEELIYSIQLDNVLEVDAVLNVPVRDSLLEDFPEYLTWDGSITVKDSKGNDVAYTGDIAKGTMLVSSVNPQDKVIITYKLNLNKYVEGLDKILNVAVNKDVDPKDHCTPETASIYCGATEIPVEGTTIIKKTTTDSDGSGKVSPGEKVTYQIEVTNDTNKSAYDVDVRDNKLETIPSYVTFNDDIEISGATSTGSLLDGTLNFTQIEAGATVTITYSFTFADDLKDITSITNVATDNGEDPDTVDPETCDETDCDETTTEVQPADTTIKKSLVDEDGNGLVAVGEKLTYTIDVTNPTSNHAYDVVVRDSMLESLPSYVTFSDDVKVSGSTFTGSLVEGNLSLDKVSAKGNVTITYTITIEDLPKDVTSVSNIATDNGEDPTTVDPDTCDETDCDEATIDVETPDTRIKKSVVDEDGDGIVIVGETLTYTIDVTNPTSNHTYDVVVRDSMLESLPSYVTFNDDVKLSGSTFTGSLVEGNLSLDKVAAKGTVTITYSIKVNNIPKGSGQLLNLATDNGEDPTTVDPDTCDETDCSETTTDLEPADTRITKSVVDEDGDGIVIVGETLTYTIEVYNPTKSKAVDVVVRDSMLESLPSYVTFNQDVVISGSTFTGDVTEGTLKLDQIEAGNTVTITYSITVNDLPKDVTNVSNIATDDGIDPETVDPDTCEEVDCDETTTPVEEADTTIKKSVVDADGNNIAVVGEKLSYTIEVTNPTGNQAYDVVVRDSMLENLPSYLTFNDDVTIVGSTFTGNLVEGSLVLDKVISKETVTITYSITVTDLPKDVTTIANIATDNGEDPTTVDPDTCEEVDCDETTTPVDTPDTNIKKLVVDENGDDLLVVGETLTYTLIVTNPTGNHAYDVVVRDSMLENLPSYLTVSDVTIVGSTYVGDLLEGTLSLDKVVAKDEVTITYSITANDIPKEATELVNIATDNGDDPTTVDPDTCDEADCDETTTVTEVPDTNIKKSVADEDGDNLLIVGETLTYTLEVSNPTKSDALNVAVRDSMLENLPEFVTFNDDVTVDGSEYIGSLVDGSLVLDRVMANDVVVITYSITSIDTPKEETMLVNIATDNGEDPSITDREECDEDDCSEVITEIDPADTIIKKSVADENGDNLVTIGETLTYTIEVSNMTGNHAYDVVVRDDKLESIPDFVTFNENVTIVGSEYTGSLLDGTLSLDKVLANESVVITYSFTYVSTPKDMSEVLNTATDNGEDPTTVDPEECDEVDCSTATIEVPEADTVIEKSVVDASGDGLVEAGEKLTYTIKVSNPTGNHAYDVMVRDDMLESIPSFATFNQDVVINGTTYTGDLTKATLVLDAVKSNETVEIVYSLTINELPTNVSEIINVATDNGDDPSKIDSEECNDSKDCASALIPLIEIVVIDTIVETGNKVIAIIISSILVLIALLFAKRQVNSKL